MEAVKLRETPEYQEGQARDEEKNREQRQKVQRVKDALKGRTIADLSQDEKDALLEVLARRAGLIEE